MVRSMKTIFSGLCIALFVCSTALFGQESEEVVIPTEISQPPYQVGNLISEQGYYIANGDGSSINFRIVDNKIRIYWLDVNKLIMEPAAATASVRFTGSVKGRSFHQAVSLQGDVGLGSPAIMPPPHIYNVILALQDESGETYTSHAFRYTPDMDVAKEVEP